MKTISTLLTTLFLANLLILPSAQALSCQQTFPRIATIEDVQLLNEQTQDVNLKWVYTYKSTRINSGEGVTIDIDKYQEIVNEYVNNELDEFEKASEVENNGWNYEKIILPIQVARRMEFEAGDIIITGPPFEICDYRFMGVFSEEGEIKYTYINDSFNSNQYKGSQIKSEPADPVQCQGYSCQVKANVYIDGQSSTIVPGQTKDFTDGLAKFVTLIDAIYPQKGVDSESLFPWGGGEKVEYLISFNPKFQGTATMAEGSEEGSSTSSPSEETTVSETAQSTSTEVVSNNFGEVEKPNFLVRFWHWLTGLFSK